MGSAGSGLRAAQSRHLWMVADDQYYFCRKAAQWLCSEINYFGLHTGREGILNSLPPMEPVDRRTEVPKA